MGGSRGASFENEGVGRPELVRAASTLAVLVAMRIASWRMRDCCDILAEVDLR